MHHRVVMTAALAIAVSTGFVSARAEPRAVIELFTSQGCSSCPPADRLVGELARDPSIVAMSLPVDYWDYLGWKDTLANPRHTARQRGYARVRGDREVYTPQAVINGVLHAPGSDKAAIEAAIGKTHLDPASLSVPVSLSFAAKRMEVTVGANDGQNGEVWLCELAKNVPVAVASGENEGRTIIYHNVVRRWVRLGEWNGIARAFTVPTGDLGEGIDALAVIVQAGTLESPSRMLGAAIQPIR
jgi:hypothetical protein